MAITAKRAAEIAEHLKEYGEAVTLDKMKVSRETMRRAVRMHKANTRKAAPPETTFDDKNVILKRIADRFTPAELRALAEGHRNSEPVKHDYRVDFSGTSFKYCFFTDTHFSSIYFKEDHYFKMLEECRAQGVEAFFHAGDIVEGMSGRPDQIYSLVHLGFSKQKEYAIKLLSELDKPFYAISGNHDRWYLRSNGADVVREICDALPNAHFLGHDNATIEIKKTKIDLFHGEDGASYANSYRGQKIVESYTGGHKPNILLTGHDHKSLYMFTRNIHVVGGGALSLRSAWQKSKKLANHAGFWIIEMYLNTGGDVVRFSPTWYPIYE